MEFNLRRPCKNCPFRTDISFALRHSRAREIADSLEDGTFPCHKTIRRDIEDPHERLNEGTQHCAGAAIMRFKMDRPGRMLQIAERFGIFDPNRLDMNSAVFESEDEFVARRAADEEIRS